MAVIVLARLFAVVGLDLSARGFPGPTVLRDAPQGRVLTRFRTYLHASLSWSGEVPFPDRHDQRRCDGIVQGRGWRYGVEAETAPTDSQALLGRLLLKRRDGGVEALLQRVGQRPIDASGLSAVRCTQPTRRSRITASASSSTSSHADSRLATPGRSLTSSS